MDRHEVAVKWREIGRNAPGPLLRSSGKLLNWHHGYDLLPEPGFVGRRYTEGGLLILGVNDHRLKAVASGYGLKPDWVGPKGRLANSLDDFEVVVGNLGLLILNILLPHLVRNVAARGNPIAPTPEMLTPIPFAKRLIFRQQFVGALAFEILHRPRH